jgi:hypothetical protein
MKTAKKSTADRPKLDPSLTRIRSAITNGSQLLAGCDHRSARMRRLRDLVGAHLADLGGAEACSQAEMCIVRRCALMTIELELLEARFEANDGATAAELDCYQRVAGSLRRLHESLGLKRRARLVNMPTLQEYIRMSPEERAKVGA